MAKIRVHELAKEIGIPSKEMVDILQNLGMNVKNHMSTMEDTQAKWVKKRLSEKSLDADPDPPQPGNIILNTQLNQAGAGIFGNILAY
jgi:translation initiation factor IF-2